jgi:hypothetical protein
MGVKHRGMFALTHRYRHLRWAILLPCLLLLSGCCQYDLTLRFDHQLRGQIIQVISLSDRGAAVADGSLAPWLHDLETRTRQLGGTVAATGYHQRSLTVPFTTSDDLVARFNRLFAEGPPPAPPAQGAAPGEATQILEIPGLGPVPFDLAIDQVNWVFASRTHLSYDIDLRALPTRSPLAAESSDRRWATLGFRLQTPWGLGQVLPASAPPTLLLPNGGQWQLQPGERYHIEVRFWLPSLVALGAVAITLVVILGYFLRYRVWPPGRPRSAG